MGTREMSRGFIQHEHGIRSLPSIIVDLDEASRTQEGVSQ